MPIQAQGQDGRVCGILWRPVLFPCQDTRTTGENGLRQRKGLHEDDPSRGKVCLRSSLCVITDQSISPSVKPPILSILSVISFFHTSV